MPDETPRPRCPYCGECQAYEETRPSKPIVVVHNRGSIAEERETQYNTHCRKCGRRIVWGMQYGNGTLQQLATGRPRYSWSRP